MKKKVLFSVLYFLLYCSLFDAVVANSQQSASGIWKAGTARVIITPKEPIWMAGYGAREHPSKGVLTQLWAKVLALEDSKGEKVVLITTDLLGIPKGISDHIRNQLEVKYGLTKSQIILSSSHTHTGPVLMSSLSDLYPLDSLQTEGIRKYSEDLENKLVALVGKAIKSLKPAQLYTGNGITRFQVNRRNNTEATLTPQTVLNGPNDYSVPVLKVTDVSGKIKTVVFGYACHATVLSFYKLSGDYPGFAQAQLEKSYPGVTAMFFQGAGADQNPLPRRTVPLAQQYGRELAVAVERVLSEDMHKLEPQISTAYSEVKLTFSSLPTKEELTKMENEFKGPEKRWATHQLAILKHEGTLRTSYSYPVEIWKLGDLPMVALGGEVTVQYALDLKKMFGSQIFVMGYTNDVMAYIPSETILKEGGYEGETSQKVYGLPGKWNSDIQVKILREAEILAKQVGISNQNK